MIGRLNIGLFAFAAFLALSAGAQAQVTALVGTLDHIAASETWPILAVRADNGSPAYVLSLKPARDVGGHVVHIDLVLQRPGAKPDAPNLLEPPGRWHGLQPYDFNAVEFVAGQEGRGYGVKRHIHITRRKLDVTFSVAKVKIRPVASTPQSEDYEFEELAIDVAVDNAK